MNYYQTFRNWLVIEQGRGEKTASAYVGDVERLRDFLDTQEHVKQHGVPRAWDEVDESILRQYIAWLSSERKVKRRSDGAMITLFPVSPKYLRRVLSSLAVWFEYLASVEKMQIIGNPARELKRPKLPHRNPPANTEAEISTFIQAALEHSRNSERTRNWTLFAFLYYTGLRNSELCNLKMSDIRFSNGIPTSIKVIGKGNKERRIPLASSSQQKGEASTALREWLKHRGRIMAKLGDKSPHKDFVWLIPSGRKQGHPLTPSGVRAIFRRFSEITGIEAHPHKFRHSFATNAVKHGAEVSALQRLLGHSSLQTTGQYLHADERELEQVVAVLPSVTDSEVGNAEDWEALDAEQIRTLMLEGQLEGQGFMFEPS